MCMRKPALREAGILPKGGILRLYGRAKVHKSGPVYEEIWNRLIEAEKKGDPEKKGYGVLITIERAEDLSGQPLTWSLLIRRHQRARRQAETPPIVLSKFPEPPLYLPIGSGVIRIWVRRCRLPTRGCLFPST